jgi:hypothetical protein
MVGQSCCAASLFLRQQVADFETFRQVTEKGGTFLGQHEGPMSHAHQDGITSALALEFAKIQW